jgi:lipopolysaccharide biosynthesis glycosyltransferase
MKPRRKKLNFRVSEPPAPLPPAGWPGVVPPSQEPPVPEPILIEKGDWDKVLELAQEKLYRYTSRTSIDDEFSETLVRVYCKLCPQARIGIAFHPPSAPQSLPASDVVACWDSQLSPQALWNLLHHYVLSEGLWPDTDNDFRKRVDSLYSTLGGHSGTAVTFFIFHDDEQMQAEGGQILLSSNHKQTIELASLTCSKASLRHLEVQDFLSEPSPKVLASYAVLRDFLEQMDRCFTPLEQEYLMLYSGFSLFATGMRRARDIDLVVCSIEDESFNDRINYWVHPLKGKYPTDVCMSRTSDSIWTNWTNYRRDLLDRPSIEDVVLPPGAFFFFKGFKMLGIYGCLAEKICRAEATGGYGAFVDVIKIREFLDIELKLPKIASTRMVPCPEGLKKERMSRSQFLRSLQYLLAEKYEDFRDLAEVARLWGVEADLEPLTSTPPAPERMLAPPSLGANNNATKALCHEEDSHGLAEAVPTGRRSQDKVEPDGRYAYVTLLYGDSELWLYALTMAASLRASSTPYDIVLLHSADVPQAHLEILEKYFDRFVLVDDIPVSSKLFHQDAHSRFGRVFNKIHCLTLDYDKVLMCDNDLHFVHNCDYLFSLSAPAAVVHDSRLRFTMNEQGNAQDAKQRFECGNSYINAGIILLEPDKEEFAAICEKISQDWTGVSQFAHPEQTFLSGFYADRWHTIHQRHNYVTPYLRVSPTARYLKGIALDEVAVIHFAGALKPLHYFIHPAENDPDIETTFHEAVRTAYKQWLEGDSECRADTREQMYAALFMIWIRDFYDLLKEVDWSHIRQFLNLNLAWLEEELEINRRNQTRKQVKSTVSATETGMVTRLRIPSTGSSYRPSSSSRKLRLAG